MNDAMSACRECEWIPNGFAISKPLHTVKLTYAQRSCVWCPTWTLHVWDVCSFLAEGRPLLWVYLLWEYYVDAILWHECPWTRPVRCVYRCDWIAEAVCLLSWHMSARGNVSAYITRLCVCFVIASLAMAMRCVASKWNAIVCLIYGLWRSRKRMLWPSLCQVVWLCELHKAHIVIAPSLDRPRRVQWCVLQAALSKLNSFLFLFYVRKWHRLYVVYMDHVHVCCFAIAKSGLSSCVASVYRVCLVCKWSGVRHGTWPCVPGCCV